MKILKKKKEELTQPIIYSDPIRVMNDKGEFKILDNINYFTAVMSQYDNFDSSFYQTRKEQNTPMNIDLARYIFKQRVEFVLMNTITSFKNTAFTLVMENLNDIDKEAARLKYEYINRITIRPEIENFVSLDTMSTLSPNFMYPTVQSRLDLCVAILTQLSYLSLNFNDNSKICNDMQIVYSECISILAMGIDVLISDADVLYTHVNLCK